MHRVGNFSNVSAAAISTLMSWNGTRLGTGDCILINDVAHVVRACASWGSDLGLLTEEYASDGQAMQKQS